MNSLLLRTSEGPRGGFSATHGGDSGQEKKLRSPERALCSPGMFETGRFTVHLNLHPHTPRNIRGRVGGFLWSLNVHQCEAGNKMFSCRCGQVEVGHSNFSQLFSQSILCCESECVCVHVFSVFIFLILCVCVF